MFVHEADSAKGGAPLELLRLELHDEAQREQLFDGRPVTVWHRIANFQVISLLEIVKSMLCASPDYSIVGMGELELYIPGSLLEERLEFPPPTPPVLYTSANNPGAAEALAEVQARFTEIGATNFPPTRRAQTLKRWKSALRLVGAVRAVGGVQPVQAVRVTRVGSPGALASRALASRSLTGRPRAETSRGPRSQAQPTQLRPTHLLLYLNKRTFIGTVGEAFAEEVRDALGTGLPIVLAHETDQERGGCEFSTFFITTPHDLVDGGLYRPLAVTFVSGEARKVSYVLLAKGIGAQIRKGSVLRRSPGWSSFSMGRAQGEGSTKQGIDSEVKKRSVSRWASGRSSLSIRRVKGEDSTRSPSSWSL